MQKQKSCCVGNFISKLKASSDLELTELPSFGQEGLSLQQLPLMARFRGGNFWPPGDLRQLGLSVGSSCAEHQSSATAGAVEFKRKHLSLLWRCLTPSIFNTVCCLGAAVMMWDRRDSASHVYTQEKNQKQSSKSELLPKIFNASVEVFVTFSTLKKWVYDCKMIGVLNSWS